MNKKLFLFFIFMVTAANISPAMAKTSADDSFDINADESYLGNTGVDDSEIRTQGPFNKLGRGLTNIITSPGEYVVQMNDLSQGNDAMTAFFGGFFKGTVYMLGRMLNGVYDVVTFPVPFPAGYRPLWRPATVFEAFREVAA